MKIRLISPIFNSVFQRTKENNALIIIKFQIQRILFKKIERISVQIVGFGSNLASIGESIELPYLKTVRMFQTECRVPAGGWYSIVFNITGKNGDSLLKQTLGKFGVGEVFITSGQSNSANSGQTRTQVKTDQIVSFDWKKWRIANDPQPIASNTNGSPWPAMSNALYDSLHVPIGLINIGVGGTAVSQWIPGAEHYPRFKKAIEAIHIYGCRAILWHQGESDTVNHTPAEEYTSKLETIIKQTRIDAGWQIPWIVAQVSHHPDPAAQAANSMKEVVKGQMKVIEHRLALMGPNTDLLQGPQWRHDNVHFNSSGLLEHGRLWAEVILKYLREGNLENQIF